MENPAALIVLCTSLEQDPAGSPALPDFAAEVLYHVDVPVLLVGPTAGLPFEIGHGVRIAISTQDLRTSKTGFEYALALAQVCSGEITAMTPGQHPDAAGVGELVLGEVEWETMQNRCRQQHSGLRTIAIPGSWGPEEMVQYLGEHTDLLIVANPHEMAAQWRTAQAVARLLSAGTMPVLAVP